MMCPDYPPTQTKTGVQAQFLSNRLVKKFKSLAKWARRSAVSSFRVYDRDIPEIPLVIDYYSGDKGNAATLALYKRPYEKDEEEENEWLKIMKEVTAAALHIEETSVFVKTRQRQKINEKLQYAPLSGDWEMTISEYDYQLKVNLARYIDTGVYFDLRRLRGRVRQTAQDKAVLNLFCYTGSFSVAACAAGARSVDSVDLSNTYLAWTAENYALNKFPPPAVYREDVFLFLKKAGLRRRRYDIIILDPPAFSASKKMQGTLDIKRDAASLLLPCVKLLSDGGVLYFSAKNRGFKLDKARLDEAGVAAKDITEECRDEDFKGHRMPPVYMIRPDAGLRQINTP